jgi:hypothetical protein
MSIPASGAISASMLATEFSSSQAPSGPNISLGGLGTKLSTPIIFGNQVLMAASFYGQSSFSGTSFSYNSESAEDGAEACALEATEDTAYHDGSGTTPVANDHVYTDSAGTTLLATGTYKYDDTSEAGRYMVIVEDGSGNPGLVQSTVSCGR